MTKNMKSVRRQSFTLVEVIAVLLVIAILAAVAAPKFVSMATEARLGVAKAGINEAKATLSVAYAKAYLAAAQTEDPVAITAAEVVTASGLAATETFGDIVVTIASSGQVVTLTTVTVDGVAAVVSDTWTVPVQ